MSGQQNIEPMEVEPQNTADNNTPPHRNIPYATPGPSTLDFVYDGEFVNEIVTNVEEEGVTIQEGNESEEEIESYEDFLEILPREMGEKSNPIICPECEQSRTHKPNCNVSLVSNETLSNLKELVIIFLYIII